MFAGHFGLAAIVKAKKESVPLWVVMIATQLIDIIFVPLFLLGVETLEPIGTGGYGEQIIHADYTHSLVGTLLVSGLAGYIVSRRWNKKSGYVVGGVVFSHWLLDLLVHRMDLPLLPGNIGDLPLLGFGLWKYHWISIGMESLLVVIGSVLYFRSAIHRVNKSKEKNIKKAYIASVTLSLLLIFSLFTSFMGW